MPIRPGPRRHPLISIRRAISWHRRKLAVLAAVVAVLAGVNAVTPHPPATVRVVAAAHSLAGGTRLTAADLTTIGLPTDRVPAEAITDPERLVGRTVVAPMTAGSPFTEVDVVSAALARAAPSRVIMAVRLADSGLVEMLAAGDRIDLLGLRAGAGGAATAEVIAADARLITVPAAASGAGPLTAGTGGETAVIIVEVDQQAARELARASAAGAVTAVLH